MLFAQNMQFSRVSFGMWKLLDIFMDTAIFKHFKDQIND